jgi:DNA polymerase elongation subunit (family B)
MKFYTHVIQNKNVILERYIEDGEQKQREVPYMPTLYTHSVKQSPLKTIKGEVVEPKMFNSIGEARNYIQEYGKISNKPIYGMQQFAYAYINEEYPTRDFDVTQITVFNFDIETKSDEGFPNIAEADKEILSIAVRCKGESTILGLGEYQPSGEDRYVKCASETDLLIKFVDLWVRYNPEIVTGWNIELFDIPYTLNRIRKRVSVEQVNRLSPWGIVKERTIPTAQNQALGRDAPPNAKDIVGVTILDYMNLYKKFTYSQQESYALDYIGQAELGEKKLDYSEYGTLNELYKQDYQKFLDYNIKDVVLVERLDDKMKLIEQACTIAYDAGVNLVDSLTSVRMWDVIIHNFLMSKNQVVPPKVIEDKAFQVEGAYVKDPQVGMHNWVVSFDLNSLYPHLIMQYNISPETYVRDIGQRPTADEIINGLYNNENIKDFMNKHNVTVCGSGAMYTKDFQGFLPKLMETMYNDRVKWKTRMIKAQQKYEKTPTKELEYEIAKCNNMQMAKKIQLNSAYGALGNQYFRFFDTKYAESITLSGQLSIKWMEVKINEYLNKKLNTEGVDYVVAVDTDSLYVVLDELVNQSGIDQTETIKVVDFLDKVATEILEPFIDKSYQDLAKYVGAYEQKMVMKREAIADKGIWTGKKHYILNVYDNEGVRYAEPKLKMMGIESVRSSTPAVCRKAIKEALEVLMKEGEKPLRDYVDNFEKKFREMPFEDVAFPRGCRYIHKWSSASDIYRKGTPIHVRAALMYNQMLEEKKLTRRYQPIFEGDKIKFCYMKLPNPTRENVFAVPTVLPDEFALDNYIDYEKQFEKSFKEPLNNICESIGWRLEKQADLLDFFV